MGGTCSTNKTDNSGIKVEEVPNATVASSDWDDSTASDITTDQDLTADSVDRISNDNHLRIDNSPRRSALGEEESQSLNSEGKEVNVKEKHTEEDNPKNNDEVTEDPIRAVYSEKEFLSKKRQAFTLDLDLYKKLTR